MSRRVRFVLVFFLTLCVFGDALAFAAEEQDEDKSEAVSDRPSLRAVRVETGPTIDGRMDDDAWKSAPIGGPIPQYVPKMGVPMTEPTEFRVVYDDEAIYVGVWCFDSEPDKIRARVMTRDADLFVDDYLIVVLDTFLDRRNGYYFVINPNGARRDGLVGDNKARNWDWDGIWTAAATIDDEGWKAEIAIPLKTLSFDPNLSTWGFNVSRAIRRKTERGRWHGARPEVRSHHMSEAGNLTGLRGLKQGVGLDVTPYVLTRYTVDRVDSDTDWLGDFGGDVRYRVLPSLTATLSYNTDFAETEVDTRQVNLTRCPLVFPEKRAFFLEDSNIFEFAGIDSERRRTPRIIPFFSRRIGLGADGRPVPIGVAGKLAGRAGRYNIGMLNAVLEDEGEFVGENAFVGRVTRNVLEQSNVGGIVTYGDPDSANDSVLVGTDFKYRTTSLPQNQIFEAGAFVLGTYVDGPEENASGAYGMNVAYPNDQFYGTFDFTEIGEEFDAALGFVPRRGIRAYESRLSYRPRPQDLAPIRQFAFSYDSTHITNLDNEIETVVHELRPFYMRTDDGDELYLRGRFDLDAPNEEFEISDGVLIPEGSYGWFSYGGGFETSSMRPVEFEFDVALGEFYEGHRQRYSFELKLRPWSVFNAGVDYAMNFVQIPEGDFDVGLFALRAQFNVNPNLTFFHFVQHDSRTDSIGYQGRLQWEFRPGKRLALVVNQAFDSRDSNLRLLRSEVVAKLVVTFRF
ncbi:MAG: DUF5916 domain-containing protein [Planctomycetota bacterium]